MVILAMGERKVLEGRPFHIRATFGLLLDILTRPILVILLY